MEIEETRFENITFAAHAIIHMQKAAKTRDALLRYEKDQAPMR